MRVTFRDRQFELKRKLVLSQTVTMAPPPPPDSTATTDLSEVELDKTLPPGAPSGDTLLREVGPYELIGKIDEGSMGVVYKVRRHGGEKVMAMKLLAPDYSRTLGSAQRFRDEIKACAGLDHPNIVPIYDSGFVDDTESPYMVMEYIDGPSLATLLESQGRIKQERALHLFAQLADALAYAREQGVTNRDIKPANIMISNANTNSELVKLLDFELSNVGQNEERELRISRQPELIGTPLYMSPEQIKGNRLDARTDIYSFGAVMYECLSGVPPFSGKSLTETVAAHVSTPPRRISERFPHLNIDAAVEDIILRCLEKDPQDRFQSARILHHELARVIEARQAHGTTPVPGAKVLGITKKQAGVLKRFADVHWAAMFIHGALLGTAVAFFLHSFPAPTVGKYISAAREGMYFGNRRVVRDNWSQALKLAETKHLSDERLAELYEQAVDDLVSYSTFEARTPELAGDAFQNGGWQFLRHKNQSDAVDSLEPEDFSQSVPYLEKAIALTPESKPGLRLRLFQKLAWTAVSNHDNKRATDALLETVRINNSGAKFSPENWDAYTNLANLYERSGDLSKAEEMLRIELKMSLMDGNDGLDPYQLLADFYMRNDDFKREVEMRKKLVDINKALVHTDRDEYQEELKAAQTAYVNAVERLKSAGSYSPKPARL